jgi:hypothetical protein
MNIGAEWADDGGVTNVRSSAGTIEATNAGVNNSAGTGRRNLAVISSMLINQTVLL